MNQQELQNRFEFHPATADTGMAHDHVRAAFLQLAHRMNEMLPEGREKSLCLTEMQASMMWANAAIACQPPAP